MIQKLTISTIIFLFIFVQAVAQTAIETNFENPLSRVNRNEKTGAPNSVYAKVKTSVSNKKRTYFKPYTDSVSNTRKRIAAYKQKKEGFQSLSKEERVDLVMPHLEDKDRRDQLEKLMNRSDLEKISKSVDDLDLQSMDSLDRRALLSDYLDDEINAVGVDSLFAEWQFESDSLNLPGKVSYSVPDSVLFGEIIRVPDTLSSAGSFDLVEQFRGPSFSEKQVNHFKGHQDKLSAASETIRKMTFKEKVSKELKSLVKNDFSNKEQSSFNRWEMSSFFEYSSQQKAILLRPSMSISLSNRWRLGLVQALQIPIQSKVQLLLAESGVFTQYDVSRFFLHLEWNSSGIVQSENNASDIQDFLVGIGKPVHLLGVGGSLLLLYNTNPNEQKKISFRYEINLF